MKQAAASRIASYQRTLTNIHPCVSELKARIASSDMIATIAPCQMLSTPISSSSVLNRKTSGRMAVRMSYMKDCTPVLSGSARDMAEAAKAARQTGGVESASRP